MTTTWPPAGANPGPRQDGPPDKPAERRRTATPATLTIIPLADRFGQTSGHPPGDPYIEATRSKWIFELSEYCAEAVGVGG